MALIHSKQLNPKLTGSFILSGSQQDFLGTSQISFTGPSKFVGSITGSVNGDVSMSYNSTGSFGRAEIVGDASFGENVEVKQYIKHKGDTNTFINFTDNRIRFQAGGIAMLGMHKDGDAPYPVTVNNGGNRVNFRVNDRNTDLLLKTDSEAFNVGLYYAGNKKLETVVGGVDITGHLTASGDISASGNLDVGGKIYSIGDIETKGDIIAQQFIVSSSVTHLTQSFSSGSTIFGDSNDDTHQMTGSLLNKGSITTTGTLTATGNIVTQGSINASQGQIFGSGIADRHEFTGSVVVTGSLNVESGRVFEQGTSVIDHATAMAIVFGG